MKTTLERLVTRTKSAFKKAAALGITSAISLTSLINSNAASPPSQNPSTGQTPIPGLKAQSYYPPYEDPEVKISFEFRTRNELLQGVWPTTKSSTTLKPSEGILYIYLDTIGTTNEVSGVKFKIKTPQNLEFKSNHGQNPYFGIMGLGQNYDFFEGYQFQVNSLVKEEGERKLVSGQAVGENRAPIGALNYQFKTNNPSSIGTFSLEYSQVLDINGNLIPHSVIPQSIVNIPFEELVKTKPGIITDRYYNTRGQQIYSLTVSCSMEESQLSALLTSSDFSTENREYLGGHGDNESWPGTYKHYDGFNIRYKSDSPAQFFMLIPISNLNKN